MDLSTELFQNCTTQTKVILLSQTNLHIHEQLGALCVTDKSVADPYRKDRNKADVGHLIKIFGSRINFGRNKVLIMPKSRGGAFDAPDIKGVFNWKRLKGKLRAVVQRLLGQLSIFFAILSNVRIVLKAHRIREQATRYRKLRFTK